MLHEDTEKKKTGKDSMRLCLAEGRKHSWGIPERKPHFTPLTTF